MELKSELRVGPVREVAGLRLIPVVRVRRLDCRAAGLETFWVSCEPTAVVVCGTDGPELLKVEEGAPTLAQLLDEAPGLALELREGGAQR